MIQHKTYKFRLYPNKTQQQQLAKNFGCVRFIYNQMLAERIEVYKNLKDSPEALKSYKYKTEKQYKEEYEFLKEVDAVSLVQTNRDLVQAYKNFFRRIKTNPANPGFPKFKSRKSRNSYRTYGRSIRVDFDNKQIKLYKLGWIKYKDDRTFNTSIRNVTVSQNKAGHYYVSILVEEDIETKPINGNTIGIDMGLKDYITDSNGEKVEHPKYYHKIEKRIKKLNRELSRKKNGSNNRKKARIRLARKHEKLNNQKRDFLNKLTSKIIDENQIIILEDLNIAGMIQNKHLAKSIQQSNWFEFKIKLMYKANWYGREVKVVERFFPSSKTCSVCGEKNTELKLKDREWTCTNCNMNHDRDINAAINLKNTAGTVEINACENMNTQ